MSKIKLLCTNCGAPFERKWGEYNRSNRGPDRQFCTRSCAASYSNRYLRDPKTMGNTKNLNSGNRRDTFTPFRWFLARCRYRANKHENGMTLEYLASLWEKQTGTCPYTGLKLILPNDTNGWKGGRNIRNASLDRIDSGKGYVEGNVQFVAFPINTAKGEFSSEELCEMLDSIVKFQLSKNYQ